MEKRFIPNIMNTLFDEIAKNFQQSGNTITDDVLLSLYGVFDKILYNALELVETNSVSLLRLKNCPSAVEDTLLQVTNKQGLSYVLFHRINYCRCVFYQQKVIRAKSYVTCKHVIAANLAYIWNKYRTFDIDFSKDFDVFKSYINDLKKTESK